jgi:OsmC subfamily peroxiredoxin
MDQPLGKAGLETAKVPFPARAARSRTIPSRFEGKPGTNPEELIGAAHAGCFTMALSLILSEAKLTAERMDTTAEVTLEKAADGFAITAVHLALKAKVPGADQAKFEEPCRQGQGELSRVQASEPPRSPSTRRWPIEPAAPLPCGV